MKSVGAGILVGIATAGLSTAAFSQTAPEPAKVATQPSGVGEVVVTAQRRAENLQNVPVAVTALSGKQLQASGVQSVQDLGLVTPSLIETTAGGLQLTPRIRGVGTTAATQSIENPVALYVDGVYVAQSDASMMALSDVAQIVAVQLRPGPEVTAQ